MKKVIPETLRVYQIRYYASFHLYLWVDTSACELLVTGGIIRPVVSASELTWFIRYIYSTQLLQRGSQNPLIEEGQKTQWPKEKEGQTTQWPKEKGPWDEQRSTKHTHKTKDRVTRTPLKPRVNLGAPEG